MAHAIHGYEGSCRNIHGHSYELHVTVAPKSIPDTYFGSTGFVIDFKELKRIIQDNIIRKFDHWLVLSEAFMKTHPGLETLENVVVWEVEPSAENILLYFKKTIEAELPQQVQLSALRLYETADSYASWTR